MKKMLFLAVLMGFSGIKAASAESETSKKGWIPQWVYSTVEYGRPYASSVVQRVTPYAQRVGQTLASYVPSGFRSTQQVQQKKSSTTEG